MSQIFRASLVQTSAPLHSVPRVGNPPLALAVSAGVGQGQGVFVSKHSTTIQKRRNDPMSNTTANPYRISLTEMLKQEGRTFEAMAEEVMLGIGEQRNRKLA